MSLEQTAYVARRSVPARDALQAAIDLLGFDCKLDSSFVPFQSSGFLPCVLNGQASGFEIGFEDAATIQLDFPQLVPTIGNRDVAISLRWGSDMAECASVLIVSAALAHRFAAVVHCHEDDILYSPKQLVDEAYAALNEC